MKRPLSKKEYVIGMFFMLVAMLPLATSVDGGNITVLPPLGSVIGRRAMIEFRDEQVSRNRANAKLLQICLNRSQTNPDIVCPDVNDAEAVERFLKGENAGTVHPAASAPDERSVHSIFELTETERSSLRRYLRIRLCPETLDEVVPGFFGLCEQALDRTSDDRPRLKNDRSIPVELFPALQDPTLDALIRMRNPQ